MIKMSWEAQLHKGEKLDALKEWFKNRKFKSAAKAFIRREGNFVIDDYRYDHNNPRNKQLLAESKEQFLRTMDELYDEVFNQEGRSAARAEAYMDAGSD